MKQKVLVTGASGFIGNYIVQQLLQMNCSVIATSANEQKARQYPWFDRVRYIPFDLKEFSAGIDYFNFFWQTRHVDTSYMGGFTKLQIVVSF